MSSDNENPGTGPGAQTSGDAGTTTDTTGDAATDAKDDNAPDTAGDAATDAKDGTAADPGRAPDDAPDGAATGAGVAGAARPGAAAAPGSPWVRRIVSALVVVGLAAAPWVVDAYTISTASKILAMGLLAMSVTFLTGVAGLPTLAQAAYFGIGAYTAALLARAGMVIGPVQVIAAIVVAAVVALVTGSVVVRTRGVTFLMLTLAVGELAHSAAVQWRGISGGTDGLSGIPPVVPLPGMAPLVVDGLLFYYVLAVFLVLFIAVGAVVRSPYGLALRGIRDNEDRIRATGYPVYGYLLSGYAVAGGLAGAGGALWVSVARYVSPADLSFGLAAIALLAAVIGGVGSMWGAVLGAALVVLVRDYFSGVTVPFTEYTATGPLLLGASFVVVVYLLPRGFAGALKGLGGRLTSRGSAEEKP